MVLKSEQERVRNLLKDTITLLCKNGLSFSEQFSIEALIGITLDREDVFLISIKELIQIEVGDKKESLVQPSSQSNRPHKRKHRSKKARRKNDSPSEESLHHDDGSDEDVNFHPEEPAEKLLAQGQGSRPDESRSNIRATQEIGTVTKQNIAMVITQDVTTVTKQEVDLEMMVEENDDDSSSDGVVFVKQECDAGWVENIEDSTAGFLSEFDLSKVEGDGEQTGDGVVAGWSGAVELNPSTSTLPLVTGDPSGIVEPQMYDMSVEGNMAHVYVYQPHSSSTTHVPLQPNCYTCNICRKRFKDRDHLKGHMAVHTTVKIFICPFCAKSYNLKWNLKRHIAIDHKDKYQELGLHGAQKFTAFLEQLQK